MVFYSKTFVSSDFQLLFSDALEADSIVYGLFITKNIEVLPGFSEYYTENEYLSKSATWIITELMVALDWGEEPLFIIDIVCWKTKTKSIMRIHFLPYPIIPLKRNIFLPRIMHSSLLLLSMKNYYLWQQKKMHNLFVISNFNHCPKLL